jgi:hypothetical protein
MSCRRRRRRRRRRVVTHDMIIPSKMSDGGFCFLATHHSQRKQAPPLSLSIYTVIEDYNCSSLRLTKKNFCVLPRKHRSILGLQLLTTAAH